jgi:CheY-like chemotaxis protein
MGLWSALLHGTSHRQAQGRRAAFEPATGMRVLVVESESEAVEPVVRGLTDSGCEVVHERTGEGGFFRATTERFDVILLALLLPDRGGLEVLAALRQQTLATPVLIMTASWRSTPVPTTTSWRPSRCRS